MANFLNPTELRNGTVYNQDNQSFVVLRYEHNKRGRGHATIRVKVKNVVTAQVLEFTYTDGDKLEVADIARRNAQYLYKDDNKIYFMDNQDFSQFEFDLADYENESNYLKEGTSVQVVWLDSKPVSFELPTSIELAVTYTESAVAGDSATGAFKEAETETGLKVKVPLFIKIGDILKIRTEDGAYLSKA